MEILTQLIDVLKYLIDLFLHLDVHLGGVIQQYGGWTYAILFLVIFCETGLVVTPILPGDSLLFAAGALAATTGVLDPFTLFILLSVGAVLGDAVNYAIGRYLGPRLLAMNSRFLKKEYLDRTHQFYEKYGGKTIIFARFVPIIRTFAPFLAGVGHMTYARFAMYNIAGGVIWIASFVFAGYYFGNIPMVKKNFTLVIMGIIVVSVMPAVIEAIRHRKVTTRAVV